MRQQRFHRLCITRPGKSSAKKPTWDGDRKIELALAIQGTANSLNEIAASGLHAVAPAQLAVRLA